MIDVIHLIIIVVLLLMMMMMLLLVLVTVVATAAIAAAAARSRGCHGAWCVLVFPEFTAHARRHTSNFEDVRRPDGRSAFAKWGRKVMKMAGRKVVSNRTRKWREEKGGAS